MSGSGHRTPLLERGRELDALRAGMAAAVAGDGSLVLVEGVAGIGKSTLLDAAAVEAERLGATALGVRGDELVMESSFAGVRELFWGQLRSMGTGWLEGASALAAPVFEAETSDGADRDRASSVLHGLYWLTADLADRRPLALIVDDAQWLDVASARYLVYLARRIESLPVLLVAAVRTGEPSAQPDLHAALAERATVVLRPAPLSEPASGEVIRGLLGPRADDGLCRFCHAATRGNPFYLRELAAALALEGGRPTVELAARVSTLGVEAISANVLVRLAHLGGDCQRLAEALAVLGPDASLRHAATLAGLSRDRAAVAADRLHKAELVLAGVRLSFVHPIVGESISSQLPPARRATLHGHAARMLEADDAPADRVAAHLLSTGPYGDDWVVAALRRAAGEALVRGAPEAAVSCLRRAQLEPPSPDVRVAVLVELGRAEALLPTAQDFATLREALARARTASERAEIAYELALALFGVMRNSDAILVLEEALDADDALDAATIARLEAALIGGGIGDLVHSPHLLDRARPHFERARRGEIDDPLIISTLAQTAAVAGTSAREAVALAHRSLGDERLLTQWLNAGYMSPVVALDYTDESRAALAAIEAGMAEAQRRGWAPMLFQFAYFGADAALRLGDLDLAEDHAQRMFELGAELGADPLSRTWLPLVLVERGRVAEAVTLLDEVEIPATNDLLELELLCHRGRVRIADGRDESGVADLLSAGARTIGVGLSLSTATDWVPATVAALSRLGRLDEARALADQELAEATAFGARRRRAVAVATCATLDPTDAGLERLREAIGLLEGSGARLEQARAAVELGIRLDRRGHRDDAHASLRDGFELAHDCGGWALADRARAALVAAGARPRRASRTGPGALTPAEQRVARMAADGLSNRQIAQALFLSTKTIEGQLSQAYAKLGIRSRAGLATALRGSGRAAP
jgi:DNA-binding CsgD family transcriptional regulator